MSASLPRRVALVGAAFVVAYAGSVAPAAAARRRGGAPLMCAIAGYVHPDRGFVPPAGGLDAMRDVMAHRGPDDRGSWSGDGAGLASRRLAIVDLSERGRMPMATEDGRDRKSVV